MGGFVKVYEWMQELGLKPGELLAFAVIYSFGKGGEWFTGSASYLAKWIGVKDRDTVFKYLNALVSKDLLEKRERGDGGQHLCDYRPTEKTGRGYPENGQGAYPRNGQGAYPKNGFHKNRPDKNRPDNDSDKKEIYKEIEIVLTPEEFLKSHR